ncbi:MAG: type II toxin-antitoxin system PemK/MazF family toxin [Candidatus Margulisbacteria bacterium]|nr:type II toxin-antitoxin system PemK/MazF family toxin [Candidatus Margulisiibacteriota bacterium]
MTYKQFVVIVVPFPFTDTASSKRRPAVVISANGFNKNSKHVVCAMITSAKNSSWESDIPMTDLDSAGLTNESMIRCKFFTLDQKLINRTIGSLGKKDKALFSKTIKNILL